MEHNQALYHSLLYTAIENGDFPMVEFLLPKDIDFTTTNKEGYTFLEHANLMYEKYPNYNRSKILDYIKSANSKRFKIMTATVKDESPLKDETYNVSVNVTGFPDNIVKCAHEGHHYEITNLVSDGEGNLTPTDNTTTLNFFLKDQETGKIQDGVMNEQVFAILLDRIYKLNDKFHCVENELMISHLESCIKLCELRRRNRIDRGVLGKHLK